MNARRKHRVIVEVTFDEAVSKAEAARAVREHFDYCTPARMGAGFEIKSVKQLNEQEQPL